MAPLERGINNETINEVFENMLKPSYWGDEFARKTIEELMNVRFLIFDERGIPVVGTIHSTSLNYYPYTFILLHLSGSRLRFGGHYTPLIHKPTGRGSFTAKTLPKDIISQYRAGIPIRVLDDGTLPWFYTLRI